MAKNNNRYCIINILKVSKIKWITNSIIRTKFYLLLETNNIMYLRGFKTHQIWFTLWLKNLNLKCKAWMFKFFLLDQIYATKIYMNKWKVTYRNYSKFLFVKVYIKLLTTYPCNLYSFKIQWICTRNQLYP